MKKILVPVDFSKHSEYAIIAAANLAKKHKAEILALHMLNVGEGLITHDDSHSIKETLFLMKLAEKRFESFLSNEILEGVKVTQMVKNHKVFYELNETGKSVDADLVVMGSHGMGVLEEVFVGSNTEKVVRTSEIPVLVVKQARLDFKIKTVVFASDFKINEVKVFEKAIGLFNSIKAKVDLLYINLPGDHFRSSDEIEKRIKTFFDKIKTVKNYKASDVVIRNDYAVERGLFAYAEKREVDLISIATHGRVGLSHFFLGSIGEDVAKHAVLPVMTFRI